ncbi:pyridoxal-5-phosphate-dependent protein subunit beta, partial [candidate division WWE3 bacterium CG_4_10_14_0_2_um_filter_42_8]
MNRQILEKAKKRCRERGIVLPTFAEQRDPTKISEATKERLKNVGLWDIDPVNLFRITWKNDVRSRGFHGVNFLELPSSLTGVKARIVGLVGKYFPTGAHKVGAAYGCLVPRLVTGEFDPSSQKAVWPSTGNYCRGGAYDSALLACESVAILPEGMSRERFEWLEKIGSEIIATPGCESNVKEIFDKCNEMNRTRKNSIVIFNQFEEFGNGMWHYNVTAEAVHEALQGLMNKGDKFRGFVSATGSAGTICAGDRLKELYPGMMISAVEALQCPTLLCNGFGDHRIEGIGDKHIPWIHNVRNTDVVEAVDDEACIRLMRLFNEPEGKKCLAGKKIDAVTLGKLELLGISGICNMLASIRMARHFSLDANDIIFTVFTDSMELYGSRLEECRAKYGKYSEKEAGKDLEEYLLDSDRNKLLALYDFIRKRIHNLKYYTWIEQQGREL